MTSVKPTKFKFAFLIVVSIMLPLLSCMEKSVDFSPAPGTVWEIRAEGLAECLEDVVWTGSQYIAVGWNEILTSPNGSDWQLRHNYYAGKLYGVFWGNETGWVVGDSVILRSENGIDWSEMVVTSNLRDVAALGDTVVAVGDTGDVWVTYDGENWTQASAGFGCRAVSSNLAGDDPDAVYRFAAGGENFTSRGTIDGISWSGALTVVAANRWINDIILRGDVVWAVGDASRMSIRGHISSVDELTGRPLRAVAWGGNSAVVVGDIGTIIYATVNEHYFYWYSAVVQSSPTYARLNGVCFNGVGYLAVGHSGIVIGSPPGKDQ